MFGSLYLWMRQNILEERDNWFLWIPVFLGTGIIAYFKLTYEPSVKTVIHCVIFLFFSFFLAKNYSETRIVWIICAIILTGFSLICLKAHLLYSDKFPYDKKFF